MNLKTYDLLLKHVAFLKKTPLKELFQQDTKRFEKFSLEGAGILLDYSKNLITEETLKHLTLMAEQSGLGEKIDKMFSGKKINITENRPVLHTALRNRGADSVIVDGKDVMPEVKRVLDKIRLFSNAIRKCKWTGFTGKPIKNIVNIGIGGSNLGPAMVTEALRAYSAPDIEFHFVSNIDGTHISETLKNLSAETTLFIICSKTFTTLETMTNAATARKWFLEKGGREGDIEKHFVAVSTNTSEVEKFGINAENMFEFWDWVGGRYSVWSAIGLSIVLSIGMDRFEEFLQGAYEMDKHFKKADFDKNIPVLLGLIGVLYNNFFGYETHAILPYDQYLYLLPSYLQQLDMESNGKQTTLDGERAAYTTGPIIWGQPGTDGQHAFYQLLHQGTKIVPADFIAPANSLNPVGEHHRMLLANFFAQTEALMNGKSEDQVRKEMSGKAEETLIRHRTFEGGRPSNSIMFKKLSPYTLGSLIAMYEHKVFVQGVIWNICSFDQWGVELGKQLAKKILFELPSDTEVCSHDQSTNGLINYYKKQKDSA